MNRSEKSGFFIDQSLTSLVHFLTYQVDHQ